MQVLRRENDRIRNPTVKRALEELLIPSIVMQMGRGVETGRPDTIFFTPIWPLMVEFKWAAESPSPKQLYWHQIFREMGYDVQVHNNVEEALRAIAAKVVAASVYAAGGEVSVRAWRSNPDARPRFAQDQHYARSFQFLKETEGGAENACYRAFESLLQSVACRD